MAGFSMVSIGVASRFGAQGIRRFYHPGANSAQNCVSENHTGDKPELAGFAHLGVQALRWSSNKGGNTTDL